MQRDLSVIRAPYALVRARVKAGRCGTTRRDELSGRGATQAGQGCRRVDRALTCILTRGDPRPSERVETPGCYVGLQPGSRKSAESDVNCISPGGEDPTEQQSKSGNPMSGDSFTN